MLKKKSFIVYLTFPFSWAHCISSDSSRLEGEGRDMTELRQEGRKGRQLGMQLDVLLKVLLTRNRACSFHQGRELQEGLNGGTCDKQFLSPRIQTAP